MITKQHQSQSFIESTMLTVLALSLTLLNFLLSSLMPDTNSQVVTTYYTPYACSDNRRLSYHVSLCFKVHVADVHKRGSAASHKQLTIRNLRAKLFVQTFPELGNFTHTHTNRAIKKQKKETKVFKRAQFSSSRE